MRMIKVTSCADCPYAFADDDNLEPYARCGDGGINITDSYVNKTFHHNCGLEVCDEK